MRRNILEGSRLFPYIAWISLILFSLMTYYLAIELKESAAGLGEKMEENVSALNNV